MAKAILRAAKDSTMAHGKYRQRTTHVAARKRQTPYARTSGLQAIEIS